MTITTQMRDGGVQVITLDEPDRRNPLGHAVRLNLVAVLAEAEMDDTVTAIVLTGAGGHFSVGGDIRDQAERSVAAQRARFAVVVDMVGRIVRFSKPVVAAVEGWAAGGGMALALACPVTVARGEVRGQFHPHRPDPRHGAAGDVARPRRPRPCAPNHRVKSGDRRGGGGADRHGRGAG
jgi:2-(1,2-epoxy-1,2-dihydrophenyl)acetyl-CoA isomerase